MSHADTRAAMHRHVKRQDWNGSGAGGGTTTTTAAGGGGGGASTTTQADWQKTTTTSQWQAPSSSSQAQWTTTTTTQEWTAPSSSSSSPAWSQATTTTTTTQNWWTSSSSTQQWTPSSSSTQQWTPSSSWSQAWSSSTQAWTSSSSTTNWWDSTSATTTTAAWQQQTTSTSVAASSVTDSTSAGLQSTSPAGQATFTSHSTAVVVVDASASASNAAAANSLAANAARTGSGGSNKIATGAVAGIVVGALIGVAALAGGIFWFFKKKMRDNDPDMVSPFDRDAFRRASVMLDNDDDEFGTDSYRNAAGAGYTSHSPHMSEYSMQSLTGAAAAAAGGGGAMVTRGDTLMRQHQSPQVYQQQPAFDPSQVVPVMAPPAAYAGAGYPAMNYSHAGPTASLPAPIPHGGEAAALGAYPTLSRGPSQVSRPSEMLSPGAADLSRRDSQMSEYSQYSDGPDAAGLAIPPVAAGRGGAYGYTDERGLPLVHEVDEPYTPPSATNGRFADFQQQQLDLQQRARERAHADAMLLAAAHPEGQSRSGTPENANVQQTFFSSSHESQYGDADSQHRLSGPPAGALPSDYPPFDGQVAHIGRSWSAEAGDDMNGDYAAASSAAEHHQPGAAQHRRRLSVRNGGLDDFDEEDDEQIRAHSR